MKVYFAGSSLNSEGIALFLSKNIPSSVEFEVLLHHREIDSNGLLILVDDSVNFPEDTVWGRFGNPHKILHICNGGEPYESGAYERVVANLHDEALGIARQFIGNSFNQGEVTNK